MTLSPDHGSVCGVICRRIPARDPLQYQPYAMATKKGAMPVGSTENPYSTPGITRFRCSEAIQSEPISQVQLIWLVSSSAWFAGLEGSPPVEPNSGEHQGDSRQSGRQRVGNVPGQFLHGRVGTHRNAKTVGCRRDCDAPQTLLRLKLCPRLSAEGERTLGPLTQINAS